MPAPDKDVFVIDLDGTVLRRTLLDGVRLYFSNSSNVGEPYRGITVAINRLSAKFHIVALTARAESARTNTQRWLDNQGLGFVELHHAPSIRLNETARRIYKTERLAQLAVLGYKLRYGAGDRLSDLSAYAANGMFPIVVLRPAQTLRLRRIRKLALKLNLTEADYRVFLERPDMPAWEEIANFTGA